MTDECKDAWFDEQRLTAKPSATSGGPREPLPSRDRRR